MNLDPELVRFVKLKKSKTSVQDRLVIPDILECLEPEIKKIYSEKLDAEEDEFDCNFAMSGSDQIFYLDFFLTTAMLNTYMAAHPTAAVSECLPELFSNAKNSQTPNLIPEVTILCDLCVGDFPSLCLSSQQITNLNRNVFKRQIEHAFIDPKIRLNLFDYDSNDEDSYESYKNNNISHNSSKNIIYESYDHGIEESDFSDISDSHVFNPFAIQDVVIEEDSCIFNPFVPSNAPEVTNEQSSSAMCTICGKYFSENDFVIMHVKMFHSHDITEEVLKLKYCDAGEALISSFIVQEKKVQQSTKKKNSSKTEQVAKSKPVASKEQAYSKRQMKEVPQQELSKRKKETYLRQKSNELQRQSVVEDNTRDQKETRSRAEKKRGKLFS